MRSVSQVLRECASCQYYYVTQQQRYYRSQNVRYNSTPIVVFITPTITTLILLQAQSNNQPYVSAHLAMRTATTTAAVKKQAHGQFN